MDDYPLPAFHFAVRIEGAAGAMDAAFQEVGGFGPEMETESYHEGGENRFLITLPKGIKSARLVLKRGVAAQTSPLVRWCKQVLEGGLATRIEPRSVQVMLLDGEGLPVRSWMFDQAWPAKWATDGFRSNKNEVALESVELVYAAARREL